MYDCCPSSCKVWNVTYSLYLKAHYQCQKLVETLSEVCDEADEVVDGLFERATEIAKLNANYIQISKPGTVECQRHRANAPAKTTKYHYRINMF